MLLGQNATGTDALLCADVTVHTENATAEEIGSIDGSYKLSLWLADAGSLTWARTRSTRNETVADAPR